MRDLSKLKEGFGMASGFQKSPLYTTLAPVVAANDSLLQLAAHSRRGQVPPFLFFGAIHYLLLGGVEHELGSFYRSVVGEEARPPRVPVARSFRSAPNTRRT